MWRKHPLARLILGLIVVLVTFGTVACGLFLGADFWRDGWLPPGQLEGTVKITNRPNASTLPGHFTLTTGDGQITEFELKSSLLFKLSQYLQNSDTPQTAVVTFSPNFHNIYSLRLGDFTLVQDKYEPNFPLQHWQLIPAFLLAGMLLAGLVALVYIIFAIGDLLSAPRKITGTLVARIERNDIRADGYLIQVRPWTDRKTGRFAQFELSQETFLNTDGADYVEVTYSRFFRYVSQLRVLTLAELSAKQKAALANYTTEGSGLSYAPNWRMRTFLYSDALLGLVFFTVSLVITFNYLPEGFWPSRMDPSKWFLLLIVSLLSLIIAVFLFLRFRRKQQDVHGPKRLTVGPVLSKWRVTGTSNDNRRLIVVADGGLSAGEKAVRKFDLSPALYDRLQVGDIVEIEHTPRMRFICRLEVKGHQELTGSFPL
jgi:hypothetical protein